jgi:hypothetical protein
VIAVTTAPAPTPAESHVNSCVRIDYLHQQAKIVDIGLAAACQENFGMGQERFFALRFRFYVRECSLSIGHSGPEVDCQ